MDVSEISRLSVAALKKAAQATAPGEIDDLIRALSSDSRAGVRKLAQQLTREQERQRAWAAKTTEMQRVEKALRTRGFDKICGMDEVGRGPLAGPVAAAAVILPASSAILRVDDSKKLSAKLREELAEAIKAEAVAWAVATEPESVIDAVNILEATKMAMGAAVKKLAPAPDILLIDALTIPSAVPVKAVIHGDATCYSIAAASIVAKVYRDALMRRYDEQYPQYGFARNMGYGTAEHIAAIKKYGPCPIHRQSFIKHFL
jgi:ribonuclease HII